MALAAADDAPRIVVHDWKVLLAARCERIVEIITELSWLLPCILRIAKEHAQKVASTGLAIVSAICLTSMHDAQVVDELNVTLLAIKLAAEALCELTNSVHGVHLLVRDDRHTRVAWNEWCTQERRFHELAYRLALREEEGWPALQVWLPIPFASLVTRSAFIDAHLDLLLLQLKRPVRLRHRLQGLRVVLEEFVVYPPKASNVLLAAATSTSVVTYMESKDVTRKAVAMEVHCCRNLGSSKAYVFGPGRHSFFGGVSDMTYNKVRRWFQD